MKINKLPGFLPKEITEAIKRDISEIEDLKLKKEEIKEVKIKNQRFYVKFVDYLKNLYN